jgi:peptidoglycan-N-acetylglucosamine deacetylase
MQKQAILTIDDGPSVHRQVWLDALADRRLQAVFFCEGKKLEEQYQLGLQTIKAGHHLGNHSWSHPHFSTISVEQALEEIGRTDAIIAALYKEAGVQQPAKWFRFPYGDKGDGRFGHVFRWWKPRDLAQKTAIQGILKEFGYVHLLPQAAMALPHWYADLSQDLDSHWTFDVLEWSLNQATPSLGVNTVERVFERIALAHPRDVRGLAFWKKRWLGAPAATEIILMHDQVGLEPHIAGILDALMHHVRIERIV